MAKAAKKPDVTIAELIKALPAPAAKAVNYLRKLVLAVDPEIAEHVKWNSPAFYFAGEMKPFDPKEYKRDLIVTNLRGKVILLIMPTGAKLKKSVGLKAEDFKDGRRIITFKDLADIKAGEKELVKLVREWLSLVDR